ncbi:hypothetical protein [Tenacibaculum finnmarkense]|uniref:hypothetical protein n=1 Tax=Tenacibaculum finnmarkense TaxID=2781243 RepID=UPI000C526F85|nr:hypothetical protein [Tenacibaculum finnmarkense]MCD8440743.1 hypothetical protein [Tenacibaculum finnmarkense genomovar ulcerans]MCG8208295.1 hypothetical protein [Tenacibaculum finnmarkense genomovar finnmarkense]MCG8721633.1 hypothetical protein [Tenacibaculum finnmarkense]MCM8907423.1 hypothetical protein [Tenacibaculum finnmarkense genomovar finnmarkense]SOS55530.1 hypothetical protein TFHFJT_310021 [Tenacibaculum finnmarkense]
MNYIDFQQNGGFPLETNTLTEMQKAWHIFNAFGALAGNKTIISGCEVIGNQITNGFIYLDGELLEFRGGIKQNTVVIIQEETKITFEDKTEKPVYFTRYATFGVSGNSILWSSFKYIDNLIVLSSQVKELKSKLDKKATEVDLESLSKRVKKLEDGIVMPATTSEVLEGDISNKYISPKTLPSNSLKVLNKGSKFIGDLARADVNVVIEIPYIGTVNYLIIGNLISKGDNHHLDNDVSWVYFNKTASSFGISFKEYVGHEQKLSFEYLIVAL